MYPAPFEYFTPSTTKEALLLLKQHGDNAKLLAGGHSLIPMMKLRLLSPSVIIDLGHVRDLTGIREDQDCLIIGAMTTHAALGVSPVVRKRAPLLAEVVPWIGDAQVRNRGTIGGSIAHADPAADWPAALLALDAEIVVAGDSSVRTIASKDFFVDLLTTDLRAGEIVTELRVPVVSGGHAYEKVRQPASGFALVGIAAQVLVEGHICRDVRIGLTGVSHKPARATATEAALKGRPLDDRRVMEACQHVTDGLDMLDDMHASAEFRVELARVHARRAITRAARM